MNRDAEKRCNRCHKFLLPEDFRQLRKQRTGVCKACEHKQKYEIELRAQERRREQHEMRKENYFANSRESRLRLLPDD